jgi:hypothetical protein
MAREVLDHNEQLAAGLRASATTNQRGKEGENRQFASISIPPIVRTFTGRAPSSGRPRHRTQAFVRGHFPSSVRLECGPFRASVPLLGWLLPPLQVSAPQVLQRRLLRLRSARFEITGISTVASRAETTSGEAKLTPGYSSPSVVKKPSDAGMGDAVGYGPSLVWGALPWTVIAAGTYLMAALFFLARFGAGIILSRKLVRSSQAIGERC